MNIFQKLIAGVFLALASSGIISAQNSVKVSGTVRDTDGISVISAVVKQAGNKKNATVTDIDGNFKIIVPQGQAIEISCLGFISKTVTVTDKSRNLDIVLEPDTQKLDELVVIGYGTQKKSDLT